MGLFQGNTSPPGPSSLSATRRNSSPSQLPWTTPNTWAWQRQLNGQRQSQVTHAGLTSQPKRGVACTSERSEKEYFEPIGTNALYADSGMTNF